MSGAVLDRLRQDRRERVVDQQRQPELVGRIGDGPDVRDVEARVADRLDVEGPGPVVGQGGEVLGRVALDPSHLDPEAGQGVGEQVVGAAVQAGRADDVVAGTCQVEDRQGFRCLSAGQSEARHAALERRDALLEDVGGGIHDPGVDVPELLEREEPRGVAGVLEVVGAGWRRSGRRAPRWWDRASGRRGGPGSRSPGHRRRVRTCRVAAAALLSSTLSSLIPGRPSSGSHLAGGSATMRS